MAEQPEAQREPLPLRLARLGASLYENESKVLVAEAVEALYGAEAQVAAAAASFADAYQRKVLAFVGASADVDLETVIITSGYEEPWQTSYDGGDGHFAMDVYWAEKSPRGGNNRYTDREPDWRGLYPSRRQLTNDEVAALLESLLTS